MHLALFGATGRTGRPLLAQALAAGHTVTALVRDAALLSAQPGLTLVGGDVGDEMAVAQTIAGSQAVISVLGPRQNVPDFAVSQSTAHILAAILAYSLRRLIITSGAAVRDPRDNPPLPDRVMAALVKRLARYVYEDMVRTVALVRASELDWTIVRVPRLSDGPATGRWRVGYVGPGSGISLARADLAAFILTQLTDTTWLRGAPAVSN